MQFGADAVGLCLRRKSTDLDQIKERMREVYCPHWAEYRWSRNTFEFRSGAILRMRYCERDRDADNYLGHAYTRLYVEELGTWGDSGPIRKLNATLRSAKGVSCKSIKNTNPGGVGHHWIKAEYIDPYPTGFKLFTGEDGLTKVYIPAKVQDNQILLEHDPGYIARIKASGPPQLVKAWLEGDWSIIEGAYFPEFSIDAHVVRPFLIPKHWTRLISFDWGSASPFSVGWYAVASETVQTESGRIIPRGAMVKYREWYGADDQHQGIHLPNIDIGAGIKERSGNEKIITKVADPSIFKTEGGPSIAEQIAKGGTTFSPADNNRLAGWKQLRDRLLGQDDKPMVYFFSTCPETIRTLPILQHDPYNAEDADTDAEDHAPDETRYACQSRPYTRPKPPRDKPIVGYQEMTLNQLWAKQRQPKQERI